MEHEELESSCDPIVPGENYALLTYAFLFITSGFGEITARCSEEVFLVLYKVKLYTAVRGEFVCV